MKSFDEDLSLAIFRDLSIAGLRRPAGTFGRDFPLENVRLNSSAFNVSIGHFRLESLVLELSLWNFRSGACDSELSLRDLSLKLSFWGADA